MNCTSRPEISLIGSVLASSVAFLARRSRARSRARRDRYEQAIAQLPREYRPRREHMWRWAAGFVLTCAAVSLVRGFVSEQAALVLACVTFLPGTFALARTAASRNRRIIESVRARAAQLDVATLIGLVDNLEEVYGADMRPLRTLLPAGADAYRT